MTVHLSDDLEIAVAELIETGHYADANDVITQALRLLQEREQKLDRLRALLAVGEADERNDDVYDLTDHLVEMLISGAHKKAATTYEPSPDVRP